MFRKLSSRTVLSFCTVLSSRAVLSSLRVAVTPHLLRGLVFFSPDPAIRRGDSRLAWLVLSAFIIISDQFTKYLAIHKLILHQPFPITPFFNLTLAHNTGAAFSFLDHAGKSGVLFLTLFALTMSVFILIWLLRLPKNNIVLSMALSLILGGALGNVIDRLRYGYVIDFIDVYMSEWHWPAFNIADSAICIGIAILCLICIKKEQK